MFNLSCHFHHDLQVQKMEIDSLSEDEVFDKPQQNYPSDPGSDFFGEMSGAASHATICSSHYVISHLSFN